MSTVTNESGIAYKEFNNHVFIRMPKVASTSMKQFLGFAQRDVMEIDEIKEFDDNKVIWYLTRNPFDRLVSCWINRITIQKKMRNAELLDTTFDEFIKALATISYEDMDRHVRPISYMADLVAEKNSNNVIKHFKFENLSNEMEQIRKITGKKGNLPHLRKSKRKHYTAYYNDELIKIVEDIYKGDLKRYNYTFNNGK
jgi:hypothetical protein